MPKAFVSTVINAPIERVWRVASDFNGLAAWMPGMKESVIEPGKSATEVGAVRKLSMAGTKDVLRERLEELSPEEFLITYSVLEGPLPVKNIRTSMRLRTARTMAHSARTASPPGKITASTQTAIRMRRSLSTGSSKSNF